MQIGHNIEQLVKIFQNVYIIIDNAGPVQRQREAFLNQL